MTDVLARVNGQFRFDRERYEDGEELTVPERVFETYPNTLTLVEDEDEAGDEDAEDAEEYVADPDPSDLTVDELSERIADVETVGILEAIRDAEQDGKDRETAIDALDERIHDLVA